MCHSFLFRTHRIAVIPNVVILLSREKLKFQLFWWNVITNLNNFPSKHSQKYTKQFDGNVSSACQAVSQSFILFHNWRKYLRPIEWQVEREREDEIVTLSIMLFCLIFHGNSLKLYQNSYRHSHTPTQTVSLININQSEFRINRICMTRIVYT